MKTTEFTEKELSELTVAELKELSKKYEVEIKSGWKKSEIIDALLETPPTKPLPTEEILHPEVPQSARVKRIQEMMKE